MKRIIFASLAVLTLGSGIASAQFNTIGQPPARAADRQPVCEPGPRWGRSAYYGIIRPQVDASRSIMDLQQGLHRLNPDGSPRGQLDQQGTGGLGGLQTGHAVTFFNTGNYYPMAPGGGGGNTTLGGGTGLGGYNTGLGNGFGGFGAARSFYGSTLAQPLIRP